MSDNILEQVRAIARILAERAQTDSSFAESILQDPMATLMAAGLPAEFVEEFLARSELSEVQGYLSPSCGLTVIM
jgi:hypothetical protein